MEELNQYLKNKGTEIKHPISNLTNEFVPSKSQEHVVLISEEHIDDEEAEEQAEAEPGFTGQSTQTFIIQNSFTGDNITLTKRQYAEVKNKMENENENISWDEVTSTEGLFMKFEEGVRTKIKVTGWSLTKEDTPSFDDKSKIVSAIFFNSKVVEKDGEPIEKIIKMQSKRFINAIKPFLELHKPDEVVGLSIKKIGKDQATNYDVEIFSN